MDKKTSYIAISTIACFIIVLAVLARYVYENDKAVKKMTSQQILIESMETQISSLQNGLEESLISRQKIDEEKNMLVNENDRLQLMLDDLDSARLALQDDLKMISKSFEELNEEKEMFEKQYNDLNNTVSQDNVLAALIVETAEKGSVIDKYKEILEDKNEEIIGLKRTFDQLRASNKDVEVLNDVVAKLSMEIASEKSSSSQKEALIIEVQKSNEALRKKLAEYEKQKEEFLAEYRAQIQELKIANDSALIELENKEKENMMLNAKLAHMVDIFKEQVERINLTKTNLDMDLGQVSDILLEEKSSVVLSPVRVSNESAVSPYTSEAEISEVSQNLPDIQGHILSSVSDTQSFVIIDKGNKDGVYDGLVLSVFDKKEKIGELNVVRTRESVSAAKIKTIVDNTEIKVGYMVRTAAGDR